MKLFRLLFLFLFVTVASAQQGGMWIPSLLDGFNEKEMKSLGMKMSVKDIYDVNHSSLKDAVPQFDGGCTAEVISPKGLLLTNHHCGFDAIQSHSTVEHDYLTDGFWAYNMADELPNPGMDVMFVVRIEDVTAQVLEGTAGLADADKTKKIQENTTAVIQSFPKESWQENKVRAFYEGNQYILFVTETFKDIRLVGTPPSAIGKFGSDTDNWVWPRHTGDFSLFRIYAGKDNRPAEYSKDNVPYVPKHYLPISLGGVKEGDFTMVVGYPGRTTEYLPAVAVSQLVNELDPARIEVRDRTLKVMDGFMRRDNAVKIQYAAKYASIANYWKKWQGEVLGLKKSKAVEVKRRQEQAFSANVAKAGKQAEYGSILPEFETLYAEIAPYALAREYFNEIALRNNDLLSVTYKMYQLEQLLAKGEAAFDKRRDELATGLDAFYKDYHPALDEKMFAQLMELYVLKYPKAFLPEALANADVAQLTQGVYGKTRLTSFAGARELLAGDSKAVLEKLHADPAFQVLKLMVEAHLKQVAPKYDQLNLKIASLQRTYMKAQMELNQGRALFPDANSTLRVTYGKVKGYEPKDATVYGSMTYLDGVMEKYVPGDYEFDVPKKLIDLYEAKDYGAYGVKGKMPVCFIGTNHTTGGNSGSPAVDAKGNLVGLNFDRVWEGTMSDVYYDPSLCRNIMVDIRYVLFIIDKFAGAKNLVEEMKIVNSKK